MSGSEMQPGIYSPDGRWVWDGQSWRPAPSPALPPTAGSPPALPPAPGPPSPGPGGRAGPFWFFSAPDWFQPYVLMGLIGLIPIVGAMVQLGWYLEARDNLRRGLWQLPRASFDYIDRGVRVWLALLVYGLYGLVLPALLGVALAVSAAGNADPGVIGALAAVLVLALLAEWILIGFMGAAIMGVADGAGLGPACNPLRIWRAATRSAGPSWRVFGALLLFGLASGVAILIMSVLIPLLGGLAASIFFGPAPYVGAAPGQADFDETRA